VGITGTTIAVVYEEGVFKPQEPVPASVKPHQILRLPLPDEATSETEAREIKEAPKSRTALGADLRAIRARIVASGVPLLTREQVLEEVHSHRGGYSEIESRE